jgi:uncharacterized protein YoxC
MMKRSENKTAGRNDGAAAGAGASRNPQSRMEAEGERFLKGLMGLVEEHIPEVQRKAVQNLMQQARNLLDQANKAIEENTKRVVQRLNLPTRADLEEYNRKVEATTKKLRGSVDEGVKKALDRFHFATSREVDEIGKAVRQLREDVDGLLKRTSKRKKAAANQPG